MLLHLSVILFTGGSTFWGGLHGDPLPRYGQPAVGMHPNGMFFYVYTYSYIYLIGLKLVFCPKFWEF